jgi:hypothetical protein
MSKQPKSPTPALKAKGSGGYPRPAKCGEFVDRNLVGVSPLKEQFEPAGSEPVRQRFKMAGGA